MSRKKRSTSPRKKSKFFSYLSLIALILVVTSMLVYAVFKWRINHVTQKNYKRYNSLVYDIPSEKIYIYLDDINGSKRVLSLPDTIKIPLAYGYGTYRLNVVDDLGKQENLDEQLLSQSIEYWLGIDIQATFILEVPLSDLNYFSINLQSSNLSQIEKMWWLETYKNFANTNQVIALDQSVYLEKQDDNLILTNLQRQGFAKELLFSETIASEDLQLAIVNTTANVGLASNLSTLLIGLGYDVAVVSDGGGKIERTQVLVENNTIIRDDYFLPLSSFLEYSKSDIIYKNNVLSDFRADIVILLGEDFNVLVNGE